MFGESAGVTQSHQKTWGPHQKFHHNNVCHMSSSCEVKWALLPECTCSTRPLTAPKGVGWMTIRSSGPARSFMGAGGPDAGYLAQNGLLPRPYQSEAAELYYPRFVSRAAPLASRGGSSASAIAWLRTASPELLRAAAFCPELLRTYTMS